MCAATVPLPTAVGPASTTRRLRPARPGGGKRSSSHWRARAAGAQAAEPLDGRDVEIGEDPVALALADRRERGEELGDAHGTGGRLGVLEGTPQQLLRRDDAHRDVLLQRGAPAARRNGTSGCGAVDLGWASRLDSPRYSAARPRCVRARRSGPAPRTLRLSLATTCEAT
jgi:hypothetical protein